LAAILPCLAQAQSGARIEGVVVDTISGGPVRRAVVQLRLGGGPSYSIESADYATATGPDGSFRFDRLPAGAYSLSYSRSGYLLPRISTGYSSLSITVAEGQVVKGLRYGLIPQAVVSGRVLDDEGDPVEGVPVSLLAYRYTSGMRRLTRLGASGTTNDRGEYRVARLPAGKYFLQASPEGIAPGTALLAVAKEPGAPAATYAATFYPGAIDAAQAMRVELRAGQEISGVDIQLRRTVTVRITGGLVGPDGAAMPRANLMLISAQSHLPAGFGTSADGVGNFTLNNVRPGSYLLNAFASDSRNISVPLEVGTTDITGFIARANPPLSLRGSVTLEDAARNVNLTAVGVNLRSVDSGMMIASARAEADGAFILENVPPGRYLADVFAGASGAYVQSITAGGEEVRGREFEVSAASQGLKILLRTDSATLQGTVDSSNGAAGTAERPGRPSVILIAADPHFRGIDPIRPARVSSKNTFEVSGLRPGEYLAMAFEDMDESQLQDPEFLDLLETLGTRVQLAPGGTQTVTLKWSVWPEAGAGN
jgi:hypothetical protein